MLAMLSAIALLASGCPEIGIGPHVGLGWSAGGPFIDSPGTSMMGIAGAHVEVRFAPSFLLRGELSYAPRQTFFNYHYDRSARAEYISLLLLPTRQLRVADTVRLLARFGTAFDFPLNPGEGVNMDFGGHVSANVQADLDLVVAAGVRFDYGDFSLSVEGRRYWGLVAEDQYGNHRGWQLIGGATFALKESGH